MSDIIRLLPDHVSSQIAAGEVVQRPASVVKELLENAVDAGAKKIDLIVREGGRNLIQVVDDGKGMSETDARMAFERHATSKIRETEDIFKILTKGFRGEALASIAAVAQVELKTKQKDTVTGTDIYIEGGELQFQEPVQTSEGSNFLVKNLFYNVPARRKFLKSDQVEFRHIIDEFHRVALAHEQIEFNLYHNDEEVFRLRKGNLLHRIVDIFGRKIQQMLVPINEDVDIVKLSGYVAKPEAAKKSRGEQFFFVNGRFFRSPYLNKAVQEAFEGLLQTGYNPSFFLYLTVDPEKIDVNIHPQKTEIKFEDEILIYALIRSTIKKSLGIYNIAPSLDFDRDERRESFFSEVENKSTQPSSNTFQSTINSLGNHYTPFESKINENTSQGMMDLYAINTESQPSKINLFEDDLDFDEEIMRLPNGYWLCNRYDKTLILDLGKIHEVISGNFKKEFEKQAGHTLLFSIEYHINEIEKYKYKSIKKYLPDLGFEMSLDDDNVLRINAVPVGLEESQVLVFLEKIFEVLDYRTEEEFMDYYRNQWERLQSKSKNHFTNKAEVLEMLRKFSEKGFPQYTPRGKRCYAELPLEDFGIKYFN